MTQVTGTVGSYLNPQYTYDAAGNLQSVTSSNGNSRNHFFTSFNMPQSLGSSGANPASAAFIYGTDSQRVKEIFARVLNGTVKTRTVYQIHPDNAGGLFYEREIKEDGSIEHRHYVGGSVVLTSVGTGTQMLTVTATRYWHKDHLGSTAVVTDETGLVIERLAYDPFGKRRYTNGVFDANGVLRSSTTDRGYTGHEHLDDLGFIHMNGRVYDPMLGRFLSADPFIQYPDNLQSYNRYAYLFNNPLNATDPTGYFSLRKAVGIVVGAVVFAYTGNPTLLIAAAASTSNNRTVQAFANIAATAMATMACGPGCGAVAAGQYSFYSTYIQTGSAGLSLQAGATAYATAMMFYGAGQATSGLSGFWGGVAKIGAHAVAGCASASLGGGNCGQGAMSAAVAKGITIGLEGYYGNQRIPFEVGFTAAVVSGGIAAELGGGKFANGAVTGAFGYLFNELLHEGARKQAMQRSGYARTVYDDGTVCPGNGPCYGQPSSNGMPVDGNGQVALEGTIGAGLGLKQSTGYGKDSQGNACVIMTSCLLVGPFAAATSSISGSVSTGTVTPNSVSYQYGLFGTWSIPVGTKIEYMFGPDGLQAGASAQMGPSAGGGVQVCRQRVANKC